MSESNDSPQGKTGKFTVVESDPWARLKGASDPESYASAWLEIQCQNIPGSQQGVVVLGTPDRGPFTPAAIWPEGSNGSPSLAAAVESVFATRQPALRFGSELKKRQSHDTIVCPILVDKKICGAVAIDVDPASEDQQRQALKQLEWGSAWLETLIRRSKLTATDRLVTVIELLATSLHHERFQEAATAVATEIANVFGCERISIGFLKGQHAEVKALSHSAQFGKKANLIRGIEAAMDEAIDQHATVIYPPMAESPIQVTRAHEDFQDKHSKGNICTIPFSEGARIIGAMTLERPADQPFDNTTVKLCEHAASLLGPVLDVKRKEDRLLIEKMWHSLKGLMKKLVGPRHTALKLAMYSIIAVVVYMSVATGDYRITADASLEGTVQRVVAAPMAGYIGEANVRAGDVVQAGSVMFSLDERDLRLERLKWVSQKAQRIREQSEALAEHNRAKARILAAQIDQAEAQIALIDEQIQRIKVVAPFDGIVVSGDLSQSLGAPVERGDVLFEVAPLDAYRVILKVDEREISDIRLDQEGQLVLAGMPDDLLSIMVDKITPVSSAEEGKNFFRVEARLNESNTVNLRPGMQGVGKIYVDERKLIWIWSHKIIHWVKMFVWSWWP